MLTTPQPPRIHLPKSWQDCVKSAVLHAIALAHYAIVYARAWAADSINARVRLAAENDQLHEACALLRKELRIKDTRIAQIVPQRRPLYGPHERMAIPEFSAARGWSLKQTADTFLVTPATIASWLKRIDDQGANALLQMREPVNKFPDFVRYIVQRLKILSPAMGKVKIAETLCRAGLHLGVTTVGRILKEEPQSDPGDAAPSTRVVTAKRPNHVWHVDLTAVSTSMGFWAPWLPFALPQCWPFCWWVAVVIDCDSRRVMGIETFKNNPTAVSVSHFLECAIHRLQVDLDRRCAWIHADQAKARKAIPVPLNAEAVMVLRRQVGKHPLRVFTFAGEPVTRANNHAWRKALVRAGIENFRWHDLRHTWASWHVQQGTPLHVLQELGGWSDYEMVRRYAHLSVEHLAEYADSLSKSRLVSTKLAQSENEVEKKRIA
ncbi:MAG: tyrosine-type recombinase/integrase [Thiogranum sp.]